VQITIEKSIGKNIANTKVLLSGSPILLAKSINIDISDNICEYR